MRRGLAAALLALALAAAGCGVGEGESQDGGAELRITRDFGQTRLATARRPDVREGDTVLRFLRSERRIETRHGGNFVQAIDGLAGSRTRQRDWFFYVNGIEADVGAADYALAAGDIVRWDFRRWGAAMRVPAIVGDYPEPFVHGYGGKRFPTRVECDDEERRACRETKRRLAAAGVAVNGAALGAGGGEEVLRVIVAPWQAVRAIRSASILERGPQESGVFARFDRDGGLALLDAAGRMVRTAPPGSGLVAATALPDGGTVWVISARDEAGLDRAVAALSAGSLRDAFAVAVTPQETVPLPVQEGGT